VFEALLSVSGTWQEREDRVLVVLEVEGSTATRTTEHSPEVVLKLGVVVQVLSTTIILLDLTRTTRRLFNIFTATLLFTMHFGKHVLTLSCLTSVLTSLPLTAAFPSYGSLAGLSERELASIIPSLKETLPGKVPGPLKFNGTKLINDAAHPWKPLRPGDIRGPCPGLNTLASHGVRLAAPFSCYV
jgi:hypothetical protein